MMKTVVVIVLLALSATAQAQFRIGIPKDEEPASAKEVMTAGGDSFFSRIFDPTRLQMHQTYSASFMTSGGTSTSITSFTNTFSYKAADNLFLSADVSAVYSPYSSLGRNYANSLNGVYLSNARLDWLIGDHTFLRVSYSAAPYSNYGSYYPGW
jgi:hypothetical protein